MATITVTFRLRRTDGRNPVDVEELAAAVVEELEGCVLGSELSVDDTEGNVATYEVTALVPTRDVIVSNDSSRPEHQCPQCGGPVTSADGGRPRIYDTPACRQAAYRGRSRSAAALAPPPKPQR